MKIRFLSGPRAGQTDHAPHSQQTQLLAQAGIIEIIPMPPRGSSGWLERMAEEQRLRPSNPQDTVPINVWPPIWECGKLPISGTPIILLRSGGEVTRFDDVKAAKQWGCPKNILEQFDAQMNNNGDYAASTALAEAKRQQEDRERSEKLGVLQIVYKAIS